MELKEWMITFIRHKDIVQRRIKEIRETDDGFIVVYKDSQKRFIIMPKLKLPKDQSSIACLNTKDNLKFLLDNWKPFVDSKAMLHFVNPSSKLEKKWIITPYVHDSVADPESLKQGLNSMFDTVDEA